MEKRTLEDIEEECREAELATWVGEYPVEDIRFLLDKISELQVMVWTLTEGWSPK